MVGKTRLDSPDQSAGNGLELIGADHARPSPFTAAALLSRVRLDRRIHRMQNYTVFMTRPQLSAVSASSASIIGCAIIISREAAVRVSRR
jgi:hypothetical protein